MASAAAAPGWAVITGAGSGIGSALLHRLSQHSGLRCLAVGRRLGKLEAARREAGGGAAARIEVLAADVGTREGVAAVAAALPSGASVQYLVHNAGTLGPIGPLAEVAPEAWRQVMATNLDAPLFLTQALLPQLERAGREGGRGARVLHVGSGAAHAAYEGWGPYCVSKAALLMVYEVLRAELAPRGVLVGSVKPGIVDTPMQAYIREYDGPPAAFPKHKKFVDMHSQQELEPVDKVGAYLHWLLAETSDERYRAPEWCIRDSESDPVWKTYQRTELDTTSKDDRL